MEQRGNKEISQATRNLAPNQGFISHMAFPPGYPAMFAGEYPHPIQMGQFQQFPMPQMAYGDSNPYNQPQMMNFPPNPMPQEISNQKQVKSKRRSKNEIKGRIYKCNQCERTYLSYPALYTHIKTKHSLPGETPSLTNGRGRGRPKKNV